MDPASKLVSCVRCGRRAHSVKQLDPALGRYVFLGYRCCLPHGQEVGFDAWQRANRSRLGRFAFAFAAWLARWAP